MTPINTIVCIGGGLVGSSWATLFAKAGRTVRVYDVGEKQLEKSRAMVKENLDLFVRHEVLTEQQAKEALGRVSWSIDLPAALAGADMIQESIAEDLEQKQQLLARIDEIDSEMLFCSSSSALNISRITAKTAYPGRCVGAHPYNPPHLMPLVEITKWEKTDDACVQRAYDFYREVGQEPIILKKEAVGFIGNRLQYAYLREMIDIVMRGIASVEDVDKASLYGLGLRYGIMGPNLITDLNGGDGGIREYYEKYTASFDRCLHDQACWQQCPAEFGAEVAPAGMAEVKAHLPAEMGKTREELMRYRDGMLIGLLKLHGKL